MSDNLKTRGSGLASAGAALVMAMPKTTILGVGVKYQ
jgi:hypothetical protein